MLTGGNPRQRQIGMVQRKAIWLTWIVALLAACSLALTALAQDEPGERADASITRSVQDAILAVPALKAMDIRVETQRGIVRLTGFVNSIADIAQADRIVRRVQGVGGVRNDLRVSNRPSRA
jgi:hyperosmotically inducible periplasmic protein